MVGNLGTIALEAGDMVTAGSAMMTLETSTPHDKEVAQAIQIGIVRQLYAMISEGH